MEGHLNYNVRPGEMKMWSHNRGGPHAGLTVYILID